MGESLEAFCKLYEDSGEYQAYCFEASGKKEFKDSFDQISKECLEQNKIKSAEWLNKVVWIEDGKIVFYDDGCEGSSVVADKYDENPVEVECFDLSTWIKRNFSVEDHIVLKIDIEGAEYEVLNKMYDDETVNYVNKIYCEIHGLKCGKDVKESINLLERAEKFNHKLYIWCAPMMTKENLNNHYTLDNVKRDDKKWKSRRVKEIKTYVRQFLEGRRTESSHFHELDIKKNMLKNNLSQTAEMLEIKIPGDVIQITTLYEIDDHCVLRSTIKQLGLKKTSLINLLEETKETLV